jgi:hypothetical protein
MAERSAIEEFARDLDSDWFRPGLALLNDSLFAIGEGSPHHDALLLGVIAQNARAICEEPETETDRRQGTLYMPIALVIAALSRRLSLEVRDEHWLAAILNVLDLERQLAKVHESPLAFDLGTHARIFKDQLSEALGNAGLLSRETHLDEENRQLAAALSLNWALRYLLAYALEASESAEIQNQKNLAWMRRNLEALR